MYAGANLLSFFGVSKVWVKITAKIFVAAYLLVLGTANALALDQVVVKINQVDQLLYLSVDDYPSLSINPEQVGQTLDITHMFGGGQNKLRIQAFNASSNTAAFALQIIINNQTDSAIHVACSSDNPPCGSAAEIDPVQLAPAPAPATVTTVKSDVYFDKVFTLALQNLPAKQAVKVLHNGLGGNESGNIYINNTYTGFKVSDQKTFMLPSGNYLLGIGASVIEPVILDGFERQNGNPSPRKIVHKKYAGRYFETTAQVGQSGLTVDMTTRPPLGLQNDVSILIVPVKNTTAFDKNNVFVGNFQLDENQIPRFYQMMQAVNRDYV